MCACVSVCVLYVHTCVMCVDVHKCVHVYAIVYREKGKD